MRSEPGLEASQVKKGREPVWSCRRVEADSSEGRRLKACWQAQACSHHMSCKPPATVPRMHALAAAAKHLGPHPQRVVRARVPDLADVGAGRLVMASHAAHGAAAGGLSGRRAAAALRCCTTHLLHATACLPSISTSLTQQAGLCANQRCKRSQVVGHPAQALLCVLQLARLRVGIPKL